MAYRILDQQIKNGAYVVKVHLDETKLNRWDEPDPEYVREWEWSSQPIWRALYDDRHQPIPEKDRQRLSESEYIEHLNGQIAARVEAELERLDPRPSPAAPAAVRLFTEKN